MTSRAQSIDVVYVEEILQTTRWLLALDGKRVVGMVSLAPLVIPTGRAGHIEDVVVLLEYRGRGIGEELTHRLLTEASRLKMRHVDLTSGAHREAANRLYQRIGFKSRDTNLYRFVL